MTSPHPFTWRLTTTRVDIDVNTGSRIPFAYTVSGEAVHITNSGDLFITGPAPLFLTLFALAAGQWVMVEKVAAETTLHGLIPK